MRERRLVQHHELPLARTNDEIGRQTQKRIHRVTIKPRRIDHSPGPDRALRCPKVPFAVEPPRRHLAVAQHHRPHRQRLRQIGQRGRPRVDHMLAHHLDGGREMRGKAGDQRARLLPGQKPQRRDPVRAALIGDPFQHPGFGVCPGADKRARLHQRQAEVAVDGQVFRAPLLHEGQFQTARGRVKAGVQDRAVGLRRARQDVRPALDQHHARACQREPARHGAADDTAADDGEVERQVRPVAHCHHPLPRQPANR